MKVKNLSRFFEKQFRSAVLEPIKIARARYRRSQVANAQFIAVTGSSGKSTTSSLIAHLLSERHKIFRMVDYNTFGEIKRRFQSISPDIEFAVGELGVSKKGDMAPMAKLFRPDVAIVTLIANEHYSSFRGLEAVAEEKGALVEALPESGTAILNIDDEHVIAMASRTKARVVTFGKNPKADYQVLDIAIGEQGGVNVTMRLKGETKTFCTNLVGEHFALSISASIAAASEAGLTSEYIAERLLSFSGLSFRMSIHKVNGGPKFLLDTAKAPLHSLNLAFDTIAGAKHIGRKRIVLGTISDYSKSRKKVYSDAVKQALFAADEVIFIEDGKGGAPNANIVDAVGRFAVFASIIEAANYIKDTALDDDLILLKSSANLHLERLFLQFVQDQKCWETACGKTENCITCGLAQYPFNEHPIYKRSKYRKEELYPSWYQN